MKKQNKSGNKYEIEIKNENLTYLAALYLSSESIEFSEYTQQYRVQRLPLMNSRSRQGRI